MLVDCCLLVIVVVAPFNSMYSLKNEPFDAAAATYDNDFTLSEIGKKQRNRVLHWLKESKILNNSKRVFEINCGTGYDAEWFLNKGFEVIATDASSEMVKVAQSKRNPRINFYQRNFQDISIDENVGDADIVFSNFGGLNCLSEKELRTFFYDLALKQKVGNYLAMVIMPEYCLIEDFYFLFKGKFSKINRRSKKGYLEVDVNGEKVKTFYHSPWTVKQLLSNDYQVELIKPIAFFIPPSYLESFFKRRIGVLRFLNFLERIFGSFSFLAQSSDHYLIIAKRK